jgi:beta-D-xylosidase 4
VSVPIRACLCVCVSQCDADGDAYDSHSETAEEAVAKVLRAGTDNDCGTFVTEHAMSALNQSVITLEDIEARLRMMFRVRMRLTHFDPPGALQSIPTSVICSEEGQELARDGVAQAVALLKNANSTLPLSKATTKTLAVIGPNAMLSRQSNYYAGAKNATFCAICI